jgi:molybdate transport system substrate-binding protein
MSASGCDRATRPRGSLLLCLHHEVSDQVRGLADLSRDEIKRIAIANPEYAPYVAAARQALERAGLWSSLESKIVRASSVGQALTYLQNGGAEAVLVSHAQVGPQLRVIEVDATLYDSLIQALGIVAATKQPEHVRALAKFNLGVEGQALLRRNGFLTVDAALTPNDAPNPTNQPSR